MADAPQPERPRSTVVAAALLVGGIAVIGILAFGVSLLQRPPAPPPAPRATPAPPPTLVASPTPVAHGPVSSFGFSVVDDPATHRVVLFGGVDSYADTWLWDGTAWSRALPRTSPPGRFHAAAAYDPVTGLVMIFGGRLAPGELVADTWAWDGTTWRELDSGSGGPPPGEGAVMAWDGANGEMVLVTPTPSDTFGQTWIWSGSHWTRRSGGDLAASPIAGQMAFDPVSSTLIFVSPLLPPTGMGITTWRWNGGGWQEVPATPPTASAGLALDPASGRLLLCSNPTPAAPAELWTWNGTGWSLVPGSAFAAELGSEVTDLDRGQFLMLGFVAPATQLSPAAVHVWGWSAGGWQQLD